MAVYSSYYLNQQAGSNVSWFSMTMSFVGVNFLGGSATFKNSDGTLTILHGDVFGFSVDGNGVLQGTIRWITHTTDPGSTTIPAEEFQAMGGAFDHLNIDASAFFLAGQNGRFDLVFDRSTAFNGDAGDNLFEGHQFGDTFIGAGGTGDRVSYLRATGGVTADLAGIELQKGFAAGDTYSGIEGFVGSQHDDMLLGDDNDNWIMGSGGGDIINGRGGFDQLDGGEGSDSIFGGYTVNGGDGTDVLQPSDVQGAVIRGGGGDDLFIGGKGYLTLIDGTVGLDTLSFYQVSSSVRVEINTYDDGFAQNIDGAGNFYYFLKNVPNVEGGSGNDVLIVRNVVGINFANHLKGNGGDDFLQGGTGDDTFDGGPGLDVMSFADTDSFIPLVLTLAAGGNGSTGYAEPAFGNDTYISIEGIEGTGHADTLTGNATRNVLSGGGGDDLLNGMAGSDDLRGGDGFDTITFASNSEFGIILAMTAPGQGTAATGSRRPDIDSFSGVEKIIGSNFDDRMSGTGGAQEFAAGSGADRLIGGWDNDVLRGGDGNDLILGDDDWNFQDGYIAYGNDILDGGVGDDVLFGGNGDNVLIGDFGTDTADYSSMVYDVGIGDYSISANLITGVIQRFFTNEFLDTYLQGTDTVQGAAGLENVIGTTGADTIIGDSGSNTLTGNSGKDVINGAGGKDTLDGGAGDDELLGGVGSDTLFGGEGNDAMAGGDRNDTYYVADAGDRVNEAVDAGKDLVVTALGALTLSQNVEQLLYEGASAFSGRGNVLNNAITGGLLNDALLGLEGNDRLYGLDGKDTLRGGLGNDRLTGGAGNDRFLFAEALTGGGFGKDIVTDFQDGGDVIRVLASVADSITDFTISGNGTAAVTLTLDAANIITLLSGGPAITITAADFQFI